MSIMNVIGGAKQLLLTAEEHLIVKDLTQSQKRERGREGEKQGEKKGEEDAILEWHAVHPLCFLCSSLLPHFRLPNPLL